MVSMLVQSVKVIIIVAFIVAVFDSVSSNFENKKKCVCLAITAVDCSGTCLNNASCDEVQQKCICQVGFTGELDSAICWISSMI
jgi:hypothetical protein